MAKFGQYTDYKATARVEDAQRLLIHYLTDCGKKRMDPDNYSEIRSIVDLIVSAAVAEAVAEIAKMPVKVSA